MADVYSYENRLTFNEPKRKGILPPNLVVCHGKDEIKNIFNTYKNEYEELEKKKVPEDKRIYVKGNKLRDGLISEGKCWRLPTPQIILIINHDQGLIQGYQWKATKSEPFARSFWALGVRIRLLGMTQPEDINKLREEKRDNSEQTL